MSATSLASQYEAHLGVVGVDNCLGRLDSRSNAGDRYLAGSCQQVTTHMQDRAQVRGYCKARMPYTSAWIECYTGRLWVRLDQW